MKTKADVSNTFFEEKNKEVRKNIVKELKANDLTGLENVFAILESYDALHDVKKTTTFFDYLKATYLGVESGDKFLFTFTDKNTVVLTEIIHALTPDEYKGSNPTATAFKYLSEPMWCGEQLLEFASQKSITYPVDEILAIHAVSPNKGGFSDLDLRAVSILLSKIHVILLNKYTEENLKPELAQKSKEINWVLTTIQTYKKAEASFDNLERNADTIESTLTLLPPQVLTDALGVYGKNKTNLTKNLLNSFEYIDDDCVSKHIIHKITPELMQSVRSKVMLHKTYQEDKSINSFVLQFAFNCLVALQYENVKELLKTRYFSEIKHPVTTILKFNKDKQIDIGLLAEVFDNPAKALNIESKESFIEATKDPHVELLASVSLMCFTANLQKLVIINYAD